MRAAPLLLLAALLPSAHAGATEVSDAARIKKRFGKKELQQVTVLGYLPTFDAVEDFGKTADDFKGLPFYYVTNRDTLDTLGMISGGTPVVTLLRPWAGSKKFKVTYRGSVSSNTFKDWLVNEMMQQPAFVPASLAAAVQASAERQRKAVIRGYIVSEIDDPEDLKPADWDQPAKIADPKAERPDDWDDEEDGPWEAPQIDNPAFKGEWKAKRISTLMQDPDDAKPEDWDQPEMIPDPRATVPDDWDEEQDGEFAPDDIPNPAFKGEWRQKKIPRAADVKKMQDRLKTAAERYGKNAVVIVQDASTETLGGGYVQMNAAYGFTDADFTAGNGIVVEESKYSAMKQGMTWRTYKFPGGDVDAWLAEWSGGKLVDMAKQQRLAAKNARKK